jgi:hypothetical protein
MILKLSAKIKKRQQANSFLWETGVFFILLGVAIILHFQAQGVKKKISRDNVQLAALKNQSVSQLERQIKDLKTSLIKLAAVFGNKERYRLKDYDMSICFVEELNKVNQFLKMKAGEKKVDFPTLVFQEQLPSEEQALYLLNQLHALKEVANLGMDYGVNFTSVIPEEFEKETAQAKAPTPAKSAKELKPPQEAKADIEGAKTLFSRIDLICPAENLLEFIIQLNRLVPKVFFESLAIKNEETVFKVSLRLAQIALNTDWYRQPLSAGGVIPADLAEQEQPSVDSLRQNSPFSLPPKKTLPALEQLAGDGGKQTEAVVPKRFFYRGKATLKSQEVAVIEDVLNQETVFLKPGGRVGNFLLKDFSAEEVTLQNTENSEELIVKRQEQDKQDNPEKKSEK